jgi:hypothetical protein
MKIDISSVAVADTKLRYCLLNAPPGIYMSKGGFIFVITDEAKHFSDTGWSNVFTVNPNDPDFAIPLIDGWGTEQLIPCTGQVSFCS